jgi:hypothetical protein
MSLMPSSPPTCLFNSRDTTNDVTSRSRVVEVARIGGKHPQAGIRSGDDAGQRLVEFVRD